MTKLIYAVYWLITYLMFYQCTSVEKKIKDKVDLKDNDTINVQNEVTGERYVKKEELYDFEKTKTKNDDILNVTDPLDTPVHESNTLIYIEDLNKIKILNNKGVLQKLKQTYLEKGFENEELIRQIKGILSETLNIPLNQVHLHDINMLMKKWRNIIRSRNILKQTTIEDQGDDDTQTTEEKTRSSDEDIIIEIPGGEIEKNAFVDVNYLLELAK